MIPKIDLNNNILMSTVRTHVRNPLNTDVLAQCKSQHSVESISHFRHR